ncbi:MAG: zinc-ribbon domain-containing protein [Candidatus Accumulibacter sp.]|jgi:predicted Zn finger-like uncharacterized protein|nr:zinc-ribbon domain-containing protein [Accumulibacter sp.]
MKTRCPDCQTVFRVTPEQLVKRDGKVRCGCCQAVFDAFDTLLEDQPPAAAPSGGRAQSAHPSAQPISTQPLSTLFALPASANARLARESPVEPPTEPDEPSIAPLADAPEMGENEENEDNEPSIPWNVSETIAPLKAGPDAEPILPREPGEIPGYDDWAGDIIAPPLVMAIPAEKPLRWPFALAAGVLALALAGQVLFHFRGELALAVPALRPALESFSLALDGPLPLPKHADLVSIEASDLQSDPARAGLLVLNATLRNKAAYGQAYPSLELSLTDLRNTVIARRVFAPADYLPARTQAAPGPVFSGNSDTVVRLWIEVAGLDATGYRLFVFYP